MEKIPSSQKNHDILQPGLHMFPPQNGVTTFDLRFKKTQRRRLSHPRRAPFGRTHDGDHPSQQPRKGQHRLLRSHGLPHGVLSPHREFGLRGSPRAPERVHSRRAVPFRGPGRKARGMRELSRARPRRREERIAEIS